MTFRSAVLNAIVGRTCLLDYKIYTYSKEQGTMRICLYGWGLERVIVPSGLDGEDVFYGSFGKKLREILGVSGFILSNIQET